MTTVPTAEDAVLYDPLTGLPNRVLQRAHLVHALRRAERSGTQVALLFLDIDDFRDINDRLGPELGDQVLIVLAARLQACLRGTDLTARLQDNEFAIVCEDITDLGDVAMLARRVREALAVPLQVGSTTVEVRASVGTAVSDGSGRPGDLLNAADHAMWRIKRSHRRSGQARNAHDEVDD